MGYVAASDASDEDRRRADYVCDGIADNVEIQAAINALPGGGARVFRERFGDEAWFSSAMEYWLSGFPPLEGRLEEASTWVALHGDNRAAYSTGFASVLRDAGAVFDSILRELLTGTGVPRLKRDYDMRDYCSFLRKEVPDIQRRTVAIRSCLPSGVVVPFGELGAPDRVPAWWTAYNKVKHKGATEYRRGNLENAVTAVSALTLLGHWGGAFSSSPLFANCGIAYPEDSVDLSDERLLFPKVAQ